MQLIEVDRSGGQKTYVNTHHILYFEAADGGSRIYFDDGETFIEVIHPPDVLARLISPMDSARK